MKKADAKSAYLKSCKGLLKDLENIYNRFAKMEVTGISLIDEFDLHDDPEVKMITDEIITSKENLDQMIEEIKTNTVIKNLIKKFDGKIVSIKSANKIDDFNEHCVGCEKAIVDFRDMVNSNKKAFVCLVSDCPYSLSLYELVLNADDVERFYKKQDGR